MYLPLIGRFSSLSQILNPIVTWPVWSSSGVPSTYIDTLSFCGVTQAEVVNEVKKELFWVKIHFLYLLSHVLVADCLECNLLTHILFDLCENSLYR
jgi:hypothetical protein